MADSQAIKIKHPGNSAQNRENQIRLPDWLCQLCPGGPKIVDFTPSSSNIYRSISDSLPAIFMPKKLPQLVPNISFNFLQLFRTFPLFFDTFHQNHPKTTPLFDRISHFLTTFCQKSSLF